MLDLLKSLGSMQGVSMESERIWQWHVRIKHDDARCLNFKKLKFKNSGRKSHSFGSSSFTHLPCILHHPPQIVLFPCLICVPYTSELSAPYFHLSLPHTYNPTYYQTLCKLSSPFPCFSWNLNNSLKVRSGLERGIGVWLAKRIFPPPVKIPLHGLGLTGLTFPHRAQRWTWGNMSKLKKF